MRCSTALGGGGGSTAFLGRTDVSCGPATGGALCASAIGATERTPLLPLALALSAGAAFCRPKTPTSVLFLFGPRLAGGGRTLGAAAAVGSASIVAACAALAALLMRSLSRSRFCRASSHESSASLMPASSAIAGAATAVSRTAARSGPRSVPGPQATVLRLRRLRTGARSGLPPASGPQATVPRPDRVRSSRAALLRLAPPCSAGRAPGRTPARWQAPTAAPAWVVANRPFTSSGLAPRAGATFVAVSSSPHIKPWGGVRSSSLREDIVASESSQTHHPIFIQHYMG